MRSLHLNVPLDQESNKKTSGFVMRAPAAIAERPLQNVLH